MKKNETDPISEDLKQESEQFRVRLQKLQNLKDNDVEPYAYSYDKTHSTDECLEKFEDLSSSNKVVKLAGRLMTIRVMGKSIFAHLQDNNDKIQIYVKKDQVTEDQFKIFKKADIGDIFGIEGQLFLTKMGEKTIKVSDLTLLSKALRPLPEKWHGLQDKEARYRHRYIDLIANPDVRKVFRKRAKIVKAMRDFLDGEDFLEVETPILQPIYGGAAANPFTTHHNRLNQKLYLRIADELYLKKLIVGGYEKVWEFCKDFRNEGMDRNHNPEFTMVELYWAYADYRDIMVLYKRMILAIVKEVIGGTTIEYAGEKIDLDGEWREMSLLDSIDNLYDNKVTDLNDDDLKKVCQDAGINTDNLIGRGKMLDKLFSEKVRPNLIQPTFIVDHPLEISPLAKPHRTKPGLTERFQPYIGGMELGNAFSELNDPLDQKERFLKLIEQAKAGDEDAPAVLDEDYIYALEHGMPPTGGLGFGVDRLVMLLTDQHSIRDVIFFPQMKS